MKITVKLSLDIFALEKWSKGKSSQFASHPRKIASGLLELGFGERRKIYMKKKKRKEIDNDKPVGKLTIIPDFLPPPEIFFPADGKKRIKITIELDEKTIVFFKSKSDKLGTKYQKMIREILKEYAKRYG
jgi:hypothetical protein